MTIDKRAHLGGSVDTSSLFTARQIFALQMITCVLAGISLISGLVISYWFCLMRKSFRHRYDNFRVFSFKYILTSGVASS